MQILRLFTLLTVAASAAGCASYPTYVMGPVPGHGYSYGYEGGYEDDAAGAGHSTPKPGREPRISYGTGGRNPVIQSFTANPANVVPAGQTITFRIAAYDSNDDVLQYTWSATGGTLSTNAGQVVSWLPPSKPGVYTVSATVANARGGFGIASLNLTVQADGSTAVGEEAVLPAAPLDTAPSGLPAATPTPAPLEAPAAPSTATPAPEASTAAGTASVSGVVKGPDGTLADADVFLTSTADAGYQAQVKTDASGAFAFKDAPTGATLVLLASKDGFRAQSRTLAALKAADEVAYAFALEAR